MSGSITQLSALLSSDIRLTTDTGGKTVAATRVLERGTCSTRSAERMSGGRAANGRSRT